MSRLLVRRNDEEQPVKEIKEEASYWNLPHKGQIFLLVMCRITEPLAYASISPYLYYMIRDFGYDDPSTIAALGTLVMSSFALGQSLSGILWGKFADNRGRKPALLMGLVGTAISITIFGVARNVYMAILGRFLCGLLNGNVGVMRTMVAEFIGDKKKHQTRAFAILPMSMNVGNIVGPMIGGLLADPAGNYPQWFGDNQFLKRFPYILPNLFPIPIIVIAFVCSCLFIKETLHGPKVWMPENRDPLLKLGRRLTSRNESTGYEAVPETELEDEPEEQLEHQQQLEQPGKPDEEEQVAMEPPAPPKEEKRKLGEILTTPIKITLACYVMLLLHNPAFQQLFPLFFSTPRMPGHHSSWIFFNGGLGLTTVQLGFIMSIRGVIGIVLQLLVYPMAADYFGNALVHRMSIVIFPIAYFILPYLSFMKNEQAAIVATSITITIVAVARAFAIPPMTILITNATTDRKYLGTVHGLTHSVTSLARCLGPFVLGNLFSLGVKVNMIALAWWVMALIALIQNVVAMNLREWGNL